MNARISRYQKRISRKQEESVAEAVGANTQANSGAVKLGGGADVRGNGLRIECKYTEKDSYSLKKEILNKLKVQAIKGGMEIPILQLDFKVGNQVQRYAIIPWHQDDSLTVLKSTDGKSLALEREELWKLFATTDYTLIHFTGDYYKVMPWPVFLHDFRRTDVGD